MNKWINVPRERKERAFRQIAIKTKMSPFAVEKDWWVVQTLALIFEMEVGKSLVFKGGTSLTKAWGLIQRFSEDVDLAIDRDFLGFTGDLSKSQRTKLRKAAGAYTSGPFFKELQDRFQEAGLEGIHLNLIEAQDSDQDPRIIEIFYPNIIPSPGYLEAKVQIEIGCRSLREPFTVREFDSLVDEFYQGYEFAQPKIAVPTVNPERTFLEKVFLLHEEFQRPKEKVRVNRLSRHLYDLVKIAETEYAEKALTTPELYRTIVKHRQKYSRVGGVNYNLHHPQFINPIPPPEFISDWENDYNRMVEQMIYEQNSPTFEQLISSLTALKNQINQLP